MMTTGFDRTELALAYYDTYIFKGKTFPDLMHHKGPYIKINATDLSLGQRFSFTQGYFDLLCSDYAGFSVARAVAASSAVPIAFAPVVLKNYDTCSVTYPDWFTHTRERAAADPRLAEKVAGVMSYTDKEKRKFIHLVDGGITDNLGIRTLYDRVSLMGGTQNASSPMTENSIDKIVILLVNAQTKPSKPMEQSEKEPPVVEVINAVTDAQLQRYNTETLILVENGLKQWAADLSSPDRTVKPYFILVDFNSIEDMDKRHLFNNIATSFALPAEEVDNLVSTARSLLRRNPSFQELLRDIR
jgi:NTE family protein